MARPVHDIELRIGDRLTDRDWLALLDAARTTTRSSSRSGRRRSRPPSRARATRRRAQARPPRRRTARASSRLPDQPASISIAQVAGVACMTVAPDCSSLWRSAKPSGSSDAGATSTGPPAMSGRNSSKAAMSKLIVVTASSLSPTREAWRSRHRAQDVRQIAMSDLYALGVVRSSPTCRSRMRDPRAQRSAVGILGSAERGCLPIGVETKKLHVATGGLKLVAQPFLGQKQQRARVPEHELKPARSDRSGRAAHTRRLT